MLRGRARPCRTFVRSLGSRILPALEHSDDSKQKALYLYEKRNKSLLSAGDEKIYPLMQQAREADATVLSTRQFKERFMKASSLEGDPGTIQLFGRVASVRRASKGLCFVDIVHEENKVQLVINYKKLNEPPRDDFLNLIRPGDSLSAIGRPWRTRAGELSLLAKAVPQILAPCLYPPFDAKTGVDLQRLDRTGHLKAHKQARDVLRARSVVIRSLCSYLDDRGFTNVQTPIISHQTGGATATPFRTTKGQSLRIAPELWLKRLIIGGFDKVYEVGSSFRDEGLDSTHNPEFTTCELYMSFSDLEDLKSLTRELFIKIANDLSVAIPSFSPLCEEVSLSNWRQIDFISKIEKETGELLPVNMDLPGLVQYATRHGARSDGDAAKILDHLATKFIEPHCDEPTFLVNQPSLMAPLSKQTTTIINGIERTVSRRFELMIHQREYVNAYEEENSPDLQAHKLVAERGCESVSQHPDASYVEAMRWGLPPTAGWGLGVDRLVMLLTGSSRIENVMAFRALS